MTRRRGVAVGVAAAGVAAAALLALAATELVGARTDVIGARAEVATARQALAAGDAAAAAAAFDRAGGGFRAGHARLSAGPVRAVGFLPGVAANVTAARRLATAGALVAEAGASVTGELAAMPGGLDAVAPRDGTIPLAPIAALAGPLADAAERIGEAERLVSASPRRWLVDTVAGARAEFAGQLAEVAGTVRTAAALADQLPAFLGADGPRRYFLGAQNPAELRGTGGLIGAFGILTAEQGRLDISAFQTIGTLTASAPDDLPAPSGDFAARYARFSAAVHGSNVNMTPDVPTAATAIETLYTAATGQRLDGTILADPRFLEALLAVVGPTEVPDVGTVTAGDVVAFVTRDQYAALEAAENRKETLGEVAGAVLRRFLAGGADPREAVAALGAAAGDGRLLLHAADPEVQAALATAGVDGALADPGGDYLAVIGNNAAANKLDTFLRQDAVYDAHLQPDGSVRARLTVTLTNTAPTEGLHPTVLGPNIDELAAGENRTYWSVYCAPGCQLTGFLRDGEPATVEMEHEAGRPVFPSWVTLASGQSETLEYHWTVPDAWSGAEGPAGYELAIDGQPTLVEGTTTVRVHPPPGSAGAGVAPMAVRDGAATWSGAPSDRVVLQAGTAGPSRRSLARTVADALNRPLLDWAWGRGV